MQHVEQFSRCLVWRGLCAAALASAVLVTADVAHAATERVLWSFSGGQDGGLPNWSTPIPGPGGVFYGTTSSGGTNNGGVVYQVSPPSGGVGPWTETVLHNFACGGTDGCLPFSTLVMDSSGTLYGATINGGGAPNAGVVFSLTPPAGGSGPWTETILYSFAGGADGAQPYGKIARDAAGQLYGATYLGGVTGNQGGASGNGTVFRLTPPAGGTGPWTHTVLYSFTGTGGGSVDGSAPTSGVNLAKDGALYGVTEYGGVLGITTGCTWVQGCGTVFRLKSSKGGTVWTKSTLFEFGQTPQSGSIPYAAPLLLSDGTLVGATGTGGANTIEELNGGVLYQLSPPAGGSGQWTETVLKTMDQGPDFLEYPLGDLTIDAAGAVYGAALSGGPVAGPDDLTTNGGGIFKLSPPAGGTGPWTYTAVHTFTADTGDFCRTGCYPYGGVSVSKSGVLTGTTTGGGTHPPSKGKVGPGVVFQIRQ